MIHESGNIESNKQKGNLKGCTKWKVFIGRRRVGQEGINKRNERIVSGRANAFFGGGEGTARVVIMKITSLLLIKKFQIIWSHSWEWLKLQVRRGLLLFLATNDSIWV